MLNNSLSKGYIKFFYILNFTFLLFYFLRLNFNFWLEQINFPFNIGPFLLIMISIIVFLRVPRYSLTLWILLLTSIFILLSLFLKKIPPYYFVAPFLCIAGYNFAQMDLEFDKRFFKKIVLFMIIFSFFNLLIGLSKIDLSTVISFVGGAKWKVPLMSQEATNGAVIGANRFVGACIFLSGLLFFRFKSFLILIFLFFFIGVGIFIGGRQGIVASFFALIFVLLKNFSFKQILTLSVLIPLVAMFIFYRESGRSDFFLPIFNFTDYLFIGMTPQHYGSLINLDGYQYPHNFYLEILLFSGLAPFILILIISIISIFSMRLKIKNSKDFPSEVIIGLLIYSIVLSQFSGDIGYNVIVFYALGFGLGVYRRKFFLNINKLFESYNKI